MLTLLFSTSVRSQGYDDTKKRRQNRAMRYEDWKEEQLRINQKQWEDLTRQQEEAERPGTSDVRRSSDSNSDGNQGNRAKPGLAEHVGSARRSVASAEAMAL